MCVKQSNSPVCMLRNPKTNHFNRTFCRFLLLKYEISIFGIYSIHDAFSKCTHIHSHIRMVFVFDCICVYHIFSQI